MTHPHDPDTQHLGNDVSELALGHITGRERVAMASHLLTCAPCRREYDEVATTIGQLLPAVPASQPPIGFDERVLTRVGVAPARPRVRPWTRWLMAAAAVILVALGGWVVRDVVDSDGPASADAVAPLQLADGRAVGTATRATVAGRAVMVVAIVDAPADVSYTCRMIFADGRRTLAEPWPAMPTGAWVVPLDGAGVGDLTAVELVVSGTDHVWSTASFR